MAGSFRIASARFVGGAISRIANLVGIAMDGSDDEIYRILPRRLRMCGKAIGRRHQLIGIRLRSRIRAYVVDRLTKQELFVKIRFIVMQKRILRADIDLDPDLRSLSVLLALRHSETS